MQEDAAPAMTPAQYLATMPGQLAPMGFFDPAGFTNDKSISEIKRYREAEVTHGRVAMLAVLGFLVGENFGPLFDGNINGVAINQFWDVPKFFWAYLAIAIGATEFNRARIGWVEPGPDSLFAIRESYTPGDIGFDPLGLKPEDPEELKTMQTKELQNGRVAMIAIAGFVAQELVNGKEILQNLGVGPHA